MENNLDSNTSNHAEIDPMVFVRVLLSYWWILGPLTVVGGVLGVTYCYYVSPVYRAVMRYEVFENYLTNVDEGMNTPRASAFGRDINPLERHLTMLDSKKINSEVYSQLKERYKVGEENIASPKISIAAYRKVPDKIIDIQIDSVNHEFALDYMKLLISKYEEQRRQESTVQFDQARKDLQKDALKLQTEIKGLRDEITELEMQGNIKFVLSKIESTEKQMTVLLENQRNVKTQLEILRGQFPFLSENNSDPAALESILMLTVKSIDSLSGTTDGANNTGGGWGELSDWRQNEKKVLHLKAEYDYKLKKYKKGHPKMIDLKEQLDMAEKEIKIAAQLTIKHLIGREKALEQTVISLEKAAQNLRGDIEMDADQIAIYKTKLSREEQFKHKLNLINARVLATSSEVKDKYYSQILEGPVVLKDGDENPIRVWPIKWKMAAVGGFLMGALSSGLILLMFIRRVRLYNYDYIEGILHTPCLAGIPKITNHEMGDNPLFINELPKSSAVCESYRTLRTAIDQNSKGAKVIMFTSPEPGDGKTFTTLNLACVLAWTGKKILIVDGDLRRASLRKAFPNSPKHGLVDALTEKKDWHGFISKDVVLNLDYLPAGASNENATELVNSSHFDEIIAQMRDKYDYVVFDSAPVGRVVDTILMAQHMEAVILVGKLGKTSTYAIRYAINRLGKANLIGFVQNRITDSSRKYNYYQGGNYSNSSYNAMYYQSYYTSSK